MILGITGTRHGLSERQCSLVATLLDGARFSWPAVTELHHGDCVGVDSEVHELVRRLVPTVRIVVHPPLLVAYRARCRGDVVLPEKGYLDRNRDIVDACDRLLALVGGDERSRPRSGTWATVRYARQALRRGLIVYPTGREERL